MFESAEIGHVIDKQTFREQVPLLRKALLDAQYELKEKADFPVLILIHGVDGAGRSETMNLINEWLDPRLIRTVAFDRPNDEARARPWMWRYWLALPGKGRIGMFFGSYYSDMLFDKVQEVSDWDAFDLHIQEIQRFEHMLAQDGALILKFWFHLSREKQKKRLKVLEKDPATRWRVSKADWAHYEQYDQIRKCAEHMIRLTSTADAPWIVVDGEDANYRSLTVGQTLLSSLNERLQQRPVVKAAASPLLSPIDNRLVLDALELDQATSREQCRQELEMLQGRLYCLTRHPHFASHALVLAFEGNVAQVEFMA